MSDGEVMGREEAKDWLFGNLTKLNRPLKMCEICNLACSVTNKAISWQAIFTAVDDLIRENKAKSMIFPGKKEEWGLVKI